MRRNVWILAFAVCSAGTVFAAPRPNSRAEMRAHRAAAHALLEARDIDGALLELEAAYRQSCDDSLARELTMLKERRTAALRLDDDELAPVHVQRPADDDDDELAPVRVPRPSVDDDDDLAPMQVQRAKADDDLGPEQVRRASVADDDELAPVHVQRPADDDDDELAPVHVTSRPTTR